MKRIILLAAILGIISLIAIYAGNSGKTSKEIKVEGKNSNVTTLTDETFRQMIFNYDKNKDWKYEGNKPAIIDFYATWCPPCRQLSPIVDEIAGEYSGKIVVYKVDTDKEPRLAQSLGISSLPTLLFIPMNGKPQVTMGAMPKKSLVKVINEVLLVK